MWFRNRERFQARIGFTLIELLVVIAIIAVLIGLLVPAVQKVRESANRSTCTNNLKQIGLALHNYYGVNKVFPPGSIGNGGTAAAPVPAWGWGTLILPYMEQGPLFDRLAPTSRPMLQAFRADLAALQTPVASFLCPSDVPGVLGFSLNDNRKFMMAVAGQSVALAKSNYLGNGGNAGNDGIFGVDSRVRIQQIKDGTSNTLLVGERDSREGRYAGLWAGQSAEAAIVGTQALWGLTQYRMFDGYAGTITLPEQAYGSQHGGGANFLLCDGSVRFITKEVPWATTLTAGTAPLTFNNLGNKADGNPVGDY